MSRFTIFAAALLTAGLAFGQFRTSTSEVSLFAGIHMGDTFTTSTDPYTYEDMEIEDDTIFGLRWAYFFTNHASLEVTIASVNTETTYFRDDFDLYYFHGNLVWQFGRGQFNPFLTVGLGATTLKYPYETWDGWGRTSDTRFSLNYGTGFKVYLSERAGVRADLRMWWTSTGFDDFGHDYYYYEYENNLHTVELSGGFFFTF